MSKLWNTGDETTKLKTLTNQFTVGKDYIYDMEMLPYDIQASKVHAEGLLQIGVLTEEELKTLHQGLDEILNLWGNGEFVISVEQEDGHTAIEQHLTEHYGDVGKKIHTGRSRNDQVLVMQRLYTKAKLEIIFQLNKNLVQKFLDFSKSFEFVPMPGYTHTQRAMLMSVGMWSGSLAEMLMLHLETLQSAHIIVNKSPMGSAAGFGVGFDLPRAENAKKLGFDGCLNIALTSQNSRGRIEATVVSALADLGATLAHFANDLVFFTSTEFDFFEIHPDLCTGSSIMPQKHNVDPAEIMRAKHAEIVGAESALRMMTANLISGYHRDRQQTKEPLMKSIDNICSMLEMAEAPITHIKPKEENLRAKCTSELFAADRANELVKEGMSFREAYLEVKTQYTGTQVNKSISAEELEKNLRSKTHLGAPGNLGLEILEKQLETTTLS